MKYKIKNKYQTDCLVYVCLFNTQYSILYQYLKVFDF